MPKVATPEKSELQKSARKIALLEKQLVEQQHLFEQLVEEVKNGYWRWHIPTNRWNYSPAFCQFLGYESGLASDGTAWEHIIPPAHLPTFKHSLEALKNGKQDTLFCQISFQKGQGERINVCCQGRVSEWGEDQQPVVVVGMAEEIISNHVPQDALTQQQELLRFAARNIPGVNVFMFDRAFRYNLAEGVDLLPEGAERYLGKTLYDVLTPHELRVLVPIYQEVLAGKAQVSEINYRGNNYYVQFIPLADEEGAITHGIAFAVNITPIKSVEYQLSTFIKQAPISMAIFDAEVRYIAASKQWVQDYRIEHKSIIGKSQYEIIPEIGQEWKDIHQKCLTGEVMRRDEDRFLREDGTEQWIRWEVRPWYLRKNKIGGLIMISEDITQRKLSELALKRHQHGLKILTAISSNHQLSLAEQLQEVLISVADYFDLPLGIISQIKDDRYTIEYAISREDELQLEVGATLKLENTYCSITYTQDDTVAIPSMGDSVYASHSCYKQFDLETYIGSPIWVAGEKYGTINFSSPEKRLVAFTEEDVDFMRLVARWVGTTLERYANEKQLVAARREAEEATQAKTDFLSTMSHEIRTPMNAVIGMAHLLLEEDPREDQINSLNTLKFSADLLLSLINDILDFSKIEAGKIALESVDFNLRDLLQGIKAAQGIQAQEKQVKVKLHWDDDVPEMVVGDPVRIGQIINNLANNAVKFTAQGQVTIEVTLTEETAETVVVEFRVRDTGIGIPQDKLVTIFDEFSQASSSTTRQFGGTGLGLAITKKLLELHDSQIQVTSQVGVGSSFFFTLTLGKSKKEVVSGSTFTVDYGEEYLGRLRGARVLLVEDNYINQYVAARFIVKWEVDLDTADNGAEALKKLQQKEYDLVLMDLQMPVVDGYEATKNIRAWQEENNKPRIPIIALTASATPSVQEKVMAVGMDDFVSKPFVPKELFARMQHHLTHRAPHASSLANPGRIAVEKAGESVEPSAAEKSTFNVEYLEQLTDGNPEDLEDVCSSYEEMVQQFMEDLRGFQQQSDQELLSKSIHRVQATFQMFGAKTLSQLLGEVSAAEGDAKLRLVAKTIEQCEGLTDALRKYRQGLGH